MTYFMCPGEEKSPSPALTQKTWPGELFGRTDRRRRHGGRRDPGTTGATAGDQPVGRLDHVTSLPSDAGPAARHGSSMDQYAKEMMARGPTLADDGDTPTGSVHIVDL